MERLAIFKFDPNQEFQVKAIEAVADVFGRKVHLVEAEGLRNPFRREEILRTREVVYGS